MSQVEYGGKKPLIDWAADWDLTTIPDDQFKLETDRRTVRQPKAIGLHRGGAPRQLDRCACDQFTRSYAAKRSHRCGLCECGWRGPVSSFAVKGDVPACQKCGERNWKALSNEQESI